MANVIVRSVGVDIVLYVVALIIDHALVIALAIGHYWHVGQPVVWRQHPPTPNIYITMKLPLYRARASAVASRIHDCTLHGGDAVLVSANFHPYFHMDELLIELCD